MGKEIVRLKVDGHIIVGHGATQVVHVESGQCTVDVVVDHLRPEVDDAGQTAVSRLPLTAVQCDVGSCGPGVGVIGVDIEALTEPIVGLCGVFLFQIDLGLERVSRSNLRPPLDDGIGIEECLVVILQVDAADGAVEPEARHRRVEFDGAVVVGHGVSVFLLPDARDGAQVEDLLDIRVEVDGFRRVVLGADIVIEIELGHGAVIPRQPEVRLLRQCLVEILNGKYVVLIVQGYLSIGNQSVDIVLCLCRK